MRGSRSGFTAEQDAAIRRMWSAGDETDAIMAQVNALEGRRITRREELYSRVRQLKCVRPPGWQKAAQRRALAIRWERGAVASTKPASVPVPVPLWRLVGLAGELRGHGIQVPRDKVTDPSVVSAYWRRIEPGHPGFVVAPGRAE